MIASEKFKKDTLSALNNKQLRLNFRRAMDGLVEKRRHVFKDYDEWQIHFAILSAEKIHNDMIEAMTKEKWSKKMPTNLLFISGPSKTADIEQTLVYGVHGCKELIVLLIQ